MKSKTFQISLLIFVLFLVLGNFYNEKIPVLATSHDFLPIPSGSPITLPELRGIIQDIANFMIFASGFIMVIYLILAGIAWMQAGANQAKAEEAKKRLKQGVVGAIIILAFGVILQTGAAIVNRDFFGSGGGTIGLRGTCDPTDPKCASPLSCAADRTTNPTTYTCRKVARSTCSDPSECVSRNCGDHYGLTGVCY